VAEGRSETMRGVGWLIKKVDLSFATVEFRLRGSRLNVAAVKNLSRAAGFSLCPRLALQSQN
jgi:hypothetical protein